VTQEALPSTLARAERPVKAQRKWTRRLLVTLTVMVVCLLLLLWYVGVFGGNLRTVVAGRVYRSAQLTGRNLDTVLDSYGIRTVINLRGGGAQDGWYRSETASCAQRGVDHVDLSISAVRLPPPDELRKLLETFDKARYPVLFHCRGGSDRSGLAGTLYLHLYQGVPLDQAEARQLTWRYGHLSWGQAHPMNDFFDLYRQTSGGLGMREWILTRYPALYAAQPPGLRVLPQDRVKAPRKSPLPTDASDPAHQSRPLPALPGAGNR
jgi:protein tyrosine phosphatase (PTP) superfamily phosphohydrolase (DUF442 family)